MTPEDLDRAMASGDPEQVVALLEQAPEAERRACAKLARERHAQMRAHWNASYGGRGQLMDVDLYEKIRNTVFYAQIGTGSKSDLDGIIINDDEFTMRLFRARRPEWLEAWAAGRVRQQRWIWGLIRRLQKEGLIGRPQCEEYTLGLQVAGYRDGAYELLTSDPDLLEEEVWKLFEVEGDRDGSLATYDKYGRKKGWTESLVQLSREGRLDRGRLLDASLDALARDFDQFRAGWFSRFHETLAPTLEEREARADRYLSLLGSRIPPTVSFALKAIVALEKGKKLPAEALLDHIAPALAAREKGTVTTALKVLDRLAKANPALKGRAAEAACEALLHAAPEVQGAALDLVEKHGDPSQERLRSRLEERRDDVAASQRPRLEALLGATAEEEEAAEAADLSDLIARAGRIPQHFREIAGVEAALQDAMGGTLSAPALDLPFQQVPRLDPASTIQPVADLQELIDAFSQVLETSGPPEELERVLDGVSRLCAERPEDFDRRVAPLRKRANRLFVEDEWARTFWGGLPQDLAALALAWLEGKLARIDKPKNGDLDLGHFMGLRVLEVAKRAIERRPWPLLGLPTHGAGWIDPRVLVERVRNAPQWDAADAVQALLRLAPDHRHAALQAAQDLPGELGEALRHALGATEVKVGPTAALWAAAARARDPLADDPAVLQRHPNLGPDTAEAARPTFRVKHSTHTYDGTTYHHYEPVADVKPALPKKLDPLFPTVLLHQGVGLEPAERQWGAIYWPGGSSAWFERGVLRVGNNLDWWEAEWGNRVYLEALLDPDRLLGEMGRLLLGVGLAAKEPTEVALAVDALILAAQDGRLTGPAFGEVLARLASTGIAKGARWAKSLGQAGRAGALAREVVRDGLELLVASAPEMRPVDAAAILGLLHELCVESGAAITREAARTHLQTFKGGKSGSLAKALLALPPNAARPALRDAAAEQLVARVERAERWMQYQ